MMAQLRYPCLHARSQGVAEPVYLPLVSRGTAVPVVAPVLDPGGIEPVVAVVGGQVGLLAAGVEARGGVKRALIHPEQCGHKLQLFDVVKLRPADDRRPVRGLAFWSSAH